MKMKDVRPYSVWTYPYSRRYYWRHPWVLLKDFWWNIKAAYWRSKYGFAPHDVWEFGYAFLEVVPQMLKYLAENGSGYPGDEEFPTPESWRNHLISIANLLENARDAVRDEKNEYYPAYRDKINGNWRPDDAETFTPDDIVKRYIDRDVELAREQDIMIEEALELLKKTQLKALWDQKGSSKMEFIYDNVEFFAGAFVGFCLTTLIWLAASLYMWKHDHTDMCLVEEVEENKNVYECKCCGARTLHDETVAFPRYCAGCGREIEYIYNKDEGKQVTWNL